MATSRQHQLHEAKLKELLKDMPFYVEQYIDDKLEHRSPSTLLGYVHDYRIFFEWLMSEGITDVSHMRDIPLTVLETLPLETAKSFFKYVGRKDIQVSKDEKKKMEKTSVNRKISSLRSLFKYLTMETENENGEPYFYRNVMQKIEVHKQKETLNARSNKISKKILHKDEDLQLLNFIKNEYLHTLSERGQKYFVRDMERDYAIISLFLGSGIRVNELANLRLRDLNFTTHEIYVTRKGNKDDVVSVFPEAMDDLKAYLHIRNERYKGTDSEHEFVFLTKYQGAASPLSVRAIQDMVKKYTKAFNSNKSLSPHKLRHTYATQLMETEKDIVLVMNQLGHSSTTTSVLYTNSSSERSREVAENLGKRRKNLE
jgi:site-specific recombinase XerD